MQFKKEFSFTFAGNFSPFAAFELKEGYMKLFRIVFFLFFILLISANSSSAQSSLIDAKDLRNVNIDNYSDNDLLDFYQKARNNGLSEANIYELLKSRGLPESEVNKLRDRMQSLAWLNRQKSF